MKLRVMLLSLSLLSACSVEATRERNTDSGGSTDTGAGSDTGAVTDTGSGADAGSGSGEGSGGPTRVDDLGQTCAMGCNLELCVDLQSDCTAACAFDGRRGIDAYCTQPCTDTCPGGYTCLTADDDTGNFCFANPAVCGNGAVERGEACDDGNTVNRDFCKSDCSEVTRLVSYGRFTFGMGAFETVYEGDEPTVFGYTRDYGDRVALVLGGQSSQDSFGFELADITGLAPQSGLVISTTTAFYPCNYNGIGNGLTITEFDPVNQNIAGTYTSTISCWANCFDCGGDGDTRTYGGSFNIHYIPDPFMTP